MSTLTVPDSPFQSIINFRDVGQTINHLTGKSILQEGRLFRSARPDEASPKDKQSLVDTYSITSIIDLRSKSEHIAQAQKHAARPSSSSVIPQSNTSAAKPLQIPGVQYHEISLNGGAFERALLWRLSWLSLIKLLCFMLIGRRTAAISILSTQVMNPRGLAGLAQDTLSHSRSEVLQIFRILASSEGYPVLVHCTQGKDRTGLVIILVLLLCSIPHAAISADYVASEEKLLPEREERLEEIKAVGFREEFAGCPEGFAESVIVFLENGWGGVEEYLEGIGIDKKLLEQVKRNLIEDKST